MQLKPRHIFFTLCSLFLLYSIYIYLGPLRNTKAQEHPKDKIAEGRLVWQKYNCQACHQLYGLGGYLGPDLTNLTGQPKKDLNYIKGMISSGAKQMPAYHLSDNELNNLYTFLDAVNKTGNGDPRGFIISKTGMIY